MLYSEAMGKLTQMAVIDVMCRHYGIRRQAALDYLEKYDPNVSEVLQYDQNSDEYYHVLRLVIWGDASDEEIKAACA